MAEQFALESPSGARCHYLFMSLNSQGSSLRQCGRNMRVALKLSTVFERWLLLLNIWATFSFIEISTLFNYDTLPVWRTDYGNQSFDIKLPTYLY